MINFLKGRLNSIGFACKGIWKLIASEKNMWVHLIATIGVVVAAIMLSTSRADWLLLIIAIALVWICEAFNTAIEKLCNLYSTECNKRIADIKDISAGAVLIAAVFAAIIGCYVFIPHFFR